MDPRFNAPYFCALIFELKFVKNSFFKNQRRQIISFFDKFLSFHAYIQNSPADYLFLYFPNLDILYQNTITWLWDRIKWHKMRPALFYLGGAAENDALQWMTPQLKRNESSTAALQLRCVNCGTKLYCGTAACHCSCCSSQNSSEIRVLRPPWLSCNRTQICL